MHHHHTRRQWHHEQPRERGLHSPLAHHPEHDSPHDHGPHPHHSGRRGGGSPEERGGRAQRGAARFLLLDILRDGPKHGYEIIKALEERSEGRYVPSPGTVYPTLQFLEDAGLLRASQQSERKVYDLTETGRAELETRAAEIAAFWLRQTGPIGSPAAQTEIRFLREEIESLTRTTRGGVRDALDRDAPETIRRIRVAVEQCRNEVRRILTETQAGAEGA